MPRSPASPSVVSLLVAALGLLFAVSSSSIAQVPPNERLVKRDGSLGTGPLEVGPGIDPLGRPADYLVAPELGEQRGGNLFHSFDRFGIGREETATFTGPESIDNVLARVTGTSESNIDGTLRSTIPGADLYLMNPNGIVFGAHSRLDVQGSFYANTADYLLLGEGEASRWYANPSASSGLSIAPPRAFGFLDDRGSETGAITVFSGADREPGSGFGGLEVPPGRVLSLLGESPPRAERAPIEEPLAGGVRITGGNVDDQGRPITTGGAVWAPSGRIDLVSVASAGEVVVAGSAAPAGELSAFAELGVVLVAGGSTVSVSPESNVGGSAGSILIRGGEIEVRSFAELSAVHSSHTDAGTIGLYARDSIKLTQARLLSRTLGAGAGADFELEAPVIDVLQVARVMTGSAEGATGAAGDIRVATGVGGALTIRDASNTPIIDEFRSEPGAEDDLRTGLFTRTSGTGGGGDISIDTGALTLSRRTTGDPSGRIAIQTKANDVGSGGCITIDAGRISIESGGMIRSFATSTGPGGGIDVTADSLTITGNVGSAERSEIASVAESPDPPSAGTVRPGGPGGSISIHAGTLSIAEGGRVFSGSRPDGGAPGSITVVTDRLGITRAGEVASITQSQGDAGDLRIAAREWIEIQGLDLSPEEPDPGLALTGISSRSQLPASGNAGRIVLEAPDLRLTESAIVTSASLYEGRAGDVTASADRVVVSGGSVIDGSTALFGAGGNVEIHANESVQVLGTSRAGRSSRVGSLSLSFGSSGDVTITAPLLTVAGGAIATTSAGLGNLPVAGLSLTELLQPFFPHIPDAAFADDADAGNVRLYVDRLEVRDGGQIDSSSFSGGSAGSVLLEARERAQVTGEGSEIVSRPGAGGSGGGIEIHAPVLAIEDGARVSVEGTNEGLDARRLLGGGVETALTDFLQTLPPDLRFFLETLGLLEIDADRVNELLQDRSPGGGPAGSLSIETNQLRIKGGSMSASAVGTSGGSVVIDVRDSFAVVDGSIDASAAGLEAEAPVEGGSIVIGGGGSVRLLRSTVTTEAAGASGGNVELGAELLDLEESRISATAATGTGSGGDVTIHASAVALEAGEILAQADLGRGGEIRVTADVFVTDTESRLDASAGDLQLSGTVRVDAPDLDLTGALAILPESYLDAVGLLRESCAARTQGAEGSFVLAGRDGNPPTPDGPLPAASDLEVERRSRSASAAADTSMQPGLVPDWACHKTALGWRAEPAVLPK